MLTNVAILKALLSLDQLFVFKRINLSLICFFNQGKKYAHTIFGPTPLKKPNKQIVKRARAVFEIEWRDSFFGG